MSTKEIKYMYLLPANNLRVNIPIFVNEVWPRINVPSKFFLSMQFV